MHTAREQAVTLPIGRLQLPGELRLVDEAKGLVIFAHGSGSSRTSPRNQAVARALNARGLGTLLFDLLTPEEAADRRNVFDIELLAERMVAATAWARAQTPTAALRIGYFGASTGAAAALVAAAELGEGVAAVVSRGGRPDLARTALARVTAPTLLLVGSRDPEVLELNRAAARALRCEQRLEVVPGASHLFEEPGTLEEVERLAGEWFERRLAQDVSGPPSGSACRSR
jgi:predicted alpha/beta-hydrolase family hydrolase